MANKTPRFVIRGVPKTVDEWKDIVRFLNRTIEASDLAAAITAHKAEADPHPVYLTEAEGDERYSSLPIGTVMLWPSETPPQDFAIANGAEMSRDTALFLICGIVYGAGDGSTTFNIPNIPPIDAE